MIKIVLTRDPLHAIGESEYRLSWVSEDKGKNLESLIESTQKWPKVAFPFAEYLFSDDSFAVRFMETYLRSSCEVIFFCRSLSLPDIILENAMIEEAWEGLDEVMDDVDSLPFSEEGKEAVRNNLPGLSRRNASEIVHMISNMDEESALEKILSYKRGAMGRKSVVEPVEVAESIDSVGGLYALKDWIVRRRSNFSDEAREFGIPMPKGVLLLGVQGCGKSLTAKTISRVWNFPLIRLDFLSLFRKGRSVEELLQEAVRTAEQFSPVILWIDEIEKALSQEGSGAEIRRVIGWLVTWMQEKTQPVFLVATANRVRDLPPELLRKGRFDEIFFVDLPSAEERTEIFRIHLKKRGRDPESYDLSKLARQSERFSGAEIEQVVVDALINDYSRQQELSQASLENALRNTVPLSTTYEEEIKALRLWSRDRARNASGNRRVESFFEK